VSRTDDQRVLDILDAADLIAGVVKNGRKGWDQELHQLAVERLLEIIGESANTLSDDFRAGYTDVPWRDIIGGPTPSRCVAKVVTYRLSQSFAGYEGGGVRALPTPLVVTGEVPSRWRSHGRWG
jgi:hypothetical protein